MALTASALRCGGGESCKRNLRAVQVTTDAPLAPLTTLRMGGPARRLLLAETQDEIVTALADADGAGDPVLLLAGGSNVVLPDAGWPGTVVLVATRGIEVDGAEIRVAAGEPWDGVVAAAVADGLAGLEALSGIPGATGATPIQNVGAYGQEVAETVAWVRVWDREGAGERVLAPAELGLGYRTSALKRQDRLVVLEVAFALEARAEGAPVRYVELAGALGVELGDRAPLAVTRDAVLRLRRGKGMVVDPGDPDSVSAGSFFTNPVLDDAGFAALAGRAPEPPPRFAAPGGGIKTSAAWLIERAGFPRGLTRGNVGISSKHTLALVNRGGGTTAELLALAREIRDGVREAFGVELVNEPVIVGGGLDDECATGASPPSPS